MRYQEIRVLTESQLDEIRMAPSNLKQFINSPAAEGIRAGFEAEVIFKDALDDSGDYTEPDYDEDRECHDIDDILVFFGDSMGYRELQDLRNRLYEPYFEWRSDVMSERFFEHAPHYIREYLEGKGELDLADGVKQYLADELEMSDEEVEEEIRERGQAYRQAVAEVKYRFDERVSDAVDDQNDDWDEAYEEFMDDDSIYSLGENEWLHSTGLRTMIDVSNEFNLDWPYWTSGDEGGAEFDGGVAKSLANSLTADLGVSTTVASKYHRGTRNDTDWIFEPDGSLTADNSTDMPVEIVSPPMPIQETLAKLREFFTWATKHGAYTNESTGFHMSVSLPGQLEEDGDDSGKQIDFIKLALFLGDKYVLDQFERSANIFCKSALDKIKSAVQGRAESWRQDDIARAVSLLRDGLTKIASQTLAGIGGFGQGFGKYTSINPKTGYIEFRSAGNRDYFGDIEKLQNTLMRYAHALSVAGDPNAEKREYARKMYKLMMKIETKQTVDPKTGTKQIKATSGTDSDSDSIAIFSRYVAGEIDQNYLINYLKQLKSKRQMANVLPAIDYAPQGNYAIRRRVDGRPVGPVVWRFNAEDDHAAIVLGLRYCEHNDISRAQVWVGAVDNVPQELLNQPPGRIAPPRLYQDLRLDIAQNFNQPNQFNGRWNIVAVNSGEVVHTFTLRPQDQSAADRIAASWAERTGYDDQYRVEPQNS